MPLRKIFFVLLGIQGIYSLITAIWPLVDIRSFMMVTGPKTDIWLVKTVALLLLPIALCYISYFYIKTDPVHAIILGGVSAAGLAFIDFYYTSKGVIKWVYAVDGVLEVIFLLVWIYLLANYTKLKELLLKEAKE